MVNGRKAWQAAVRGGGKESRTKQVNDMFSKGPIPETILARLHFTKLPSLLSTKTKKHK